MIDLVLLTGFLGAGKTTFMKNLLDAYADKKVGVIVNEFGSISMDTVLIQRNGIEMAELSNGSIFCACIKDKFVDSLIEMSKLDLEYLFIEASGLADPANMTQILRGISAKTQNSYHYKGAVCIVDSETFLDLYDLLPAIHNQLEFSSAVIINKADLSTEEHLAQVVIKINQVNKMASNYITSYCRVDFKEIVDQLEQSSNSSRETTNTMDTKPKTFVLRAESEVPHEKLKKFLEEISGETYRMKGFVNTDQGSVEISTVGKNIYLNPWKEEILEPSIVVISSVGIRMISILSKAIEMHLKGIVHL